MALHYKIHEVKNNNIEEEIDELEKKLKDKDIAQAASISLTKSNKSNGY